MEIKRLVHNMVTIVMSQSEITFYRGNDSVPLVFRIPAQFRDIAIELYDLYIEEGYPTAIIACRGNYDIAVRLDEKSGEMIDWHYTK